MNFLKKPYIPAALTSAALLLLTLFLLLDVFVIPHAAYELPAGGNTSAAEGSGGAAVSDGGASGGTAAEAPDTGNIVSDSDSYSDGNITVTLTEARYDNTTVYLADVRITSLSYLKTAIARNTFGTNITQKTSEMAASNGAILAINGDFYGANRSGYVIKNGSLLRSGVRADSYYDDLVILSDGTFLTVGENTVSAQNLLSQGAYQLFAFGPTLVSGGSVAVSVGDEVDQSMRSNPRTAIGIIGPLHYLFVVSDERTPASTGLSLYRLAQIMKEQGCTTAYNLDGGGSSTMYFNGRVVNNPTTNGKTIGERAVSDIVYIGY